MKKSFRRKILPPVAALLFCVVARSRAAEPRSVDTGNLANPSAGAAEQQPLTLDPVIVREQPQGIYTPPYSTPAAKTDTPLLEIPQSISVVPRQLLDDQKATRLDDVLRNVAGVIPRGYYYGWDYYRIRGFDATGFTYLDGLMADRDWWFSEELQGIDRVEVYKGPASTLYGQGSLGGMVHLISKRPVKEWLLDATYTGGTLEFIEPAIDVGGPINESKTLYFRLNTLYRRRGSFVDFFEPSQRAYIAPSLTWDIGANTSVTFRIQYMQDWNHFAMPLPAEGTILRNPNGRLPIQRNVGEPKHGNPNDIVRGQGGYEFSHRFNEVFTLRQNARLAYTDTLMDAIYPAGLQGDLATMDRYRYAGKFEYFTSVLDTLLESKFATGSIKHTVVTGTGFSYYNHRSSAGIVDIDSLNIFSPTYGSPVAAPVPFAKDKTRANSVGVYFQEQAKLFDRLSIVVGGRWDFAHSRDVDLFNSGSSKARDYTFTPKGGAAYEFIPGASVFAGYSESFRPQVGFSDAGGAQVKPESGQQWEGGFKFNLMGGKLAATVAGFQLTRQNVATPSPDILCDCYVVTGEQRSRGFELEGAMNLIAGWNWTLAYAYTDAKITKDNVLPVGARTWAVPKHSFNSWMKYELQEGFLKGLGFGIGGRYYTDQEGDSTYTNPFKLPAYGLMDLALYYRTGPWRAQINLNNALNKRYFANAYDRAYVLPGEPLNAQVTMAWPFNTPK